MGSSQPLRVFISHTKEFASAHADRPYVDAAAAAINRLGHSVVEMAHFGASTDTPGVASLAALERSDLVIALIGFRRGSQIPDGSGRSYVEFEIEAAAERNIPTLVFVLSDNASVPIGIFGDAGEDGAWQARFRQRLMATKTADMFTTAGDLETRILFALGELRGRLGTTPDQRSPNPVFTVPALSDQDYVLRPELMSPLLDALQTAEISTTVGVTAALRGAGGFGKTTLALAACHEESVRRKFPDGILWVTIGEQLGGASLAATINDLSEMLSGRRPSLTMPEQAGQHFAQVLGGRRMLLVLDDVWRPTQLSPFAYGGERCVRLITTRNQALIPSYAESISVDSMNTAQSQQLLTQDLGEIPEQDWLLDYTAGWPVLISLVNALLRRYQASGQDISAIVSKARAALAYAGPTALDVANPAARAEAISLTVEASLAALAEGPGGETRLRQFLSLAVFGEDESIPIEILVMLWAHPHTRMPMEALVLSAERYCLDLVDFSLAQEYRAREGRLLLHDVMHKFLVHKVRDVLPARHRELVELARDYYAVPGSEWWRLPIEAVYMWNRLPWHLSETTDGAAELEDLVCNLHWIVRKTYCYGLATIDADLTLVNSPLAARLRRALNQCAHLLEPLGTEESVAALMLARLSEVVGLEAIVEQYAKVPLARLAPAWPLPDQPHPALLRVLPGHLGSVSAVGVIEGRSLVASAGGFDGTVHIWDLHTSELRMSLTGHSERVNSICVSPDETWIACGDGDISGSGAIRVWDLETGTVRRVWDAVSERVNVVCAFPNGRLLASGDGDIAGGGSIRVWDLQSGRLVRHLPGHKGMVTGLAVAPDGSWLASAGGFDNAVWVWDFTGKSAPALLEGHSSQITSLAISPDGAWLASAGGLDGSIRIWDSSRGCPQVAEAAVVLVAGDAEVWSLAWTPEGDRLVAGRGDGTVAIWHVATAELHSKFPGGSNCVNAVAMAGKWVVAGESGGMIRVWDTATTERPATLAGHNRPVASIAAMSMGATKLVTGDSGGRAGSNIRLWASPSGMLEHEITVQMMSITGILVDNAEGRLIAAGSDGSVRIWRLPEGTEEAILSGHDGGVWAIAAAPGISPVPRLPADPTAGPSLATAAEFKPRWLATAGGFDGLVLIWNLDEQVVVQRLPGHDGGVWALCAAIDGRWLVTGAGNGDLRCFRRSGPSGEMTLSWRKRLAAGVEKTVISGHRSDLPGTPDSPWLCVGSDNGGIDVVQVDTGQVTASCMGHSGRIRGLDISPAERYIASVAEDKIVRVWDARDLRPVTALRIGGMPNDCRWLPSGLRLCVVGDDGIHMMNLIGTGGLAEVHDSEEE